MSTELPEGVRAKTIYIARDDSKHAYLEWAVDRNRLLDRLAEANRVLEAGGSVYAAAEAAGFHGHDETLKRITKDTPLVISHWQCRDTPGYRVCEFRPDGIHVWGDAGSWSGPYGNVIPLATVAAYAKDTLARAEAEAARCKLESCAASEPNPP